MKSKIGYDGIFTYSTATSQQGDDVTRAMVSMNALNL